MSDTDNRKRGLMADGNRKIQPFVAWLEKHKRGEVDTELTHELRTLIDAVQETGKPGRITLTLKVSRKGERQVTVREDIKVSTPAHDRAESIYFVDSQTGNLQRNDPRQGVLADIHLKAAPGGDE